MIVIVINPSAEEKMDLSPSNKSSIRYAVNPFSGAVPFVGAKISNYIW